MFTNVLPGLDYFITVSHPNGCSQSTETFDILGFDTLTLSLSQGGLNEILAAANGGAAPYEFTLNGENYGSTSSFIIYATGLYTVTVTDSNGCTAEAEIPMEFIDVCIPNYFTPNGDGVADGWGPGCADIYRNLEVDIFDRYGRQVAVLRVGEYWDGKYEDKELPSRRLLVCR
ncbi:T9SS type B sorting domain-containing protein [Lacinutrix neustonica]|uniref:T9SS type B sorting domain-containing protein n=1 Tax=Lacinutrix neustonica TaxID=2980107 RepID=A0A9E8SIR9_9FLAO|nr:T9SS type B sorting domain-containing protein [Lacinutrix neustonica]WAC03935.1 T9SS type B sorting domain-containing protein [Lacinutrix neustonica]